MVLVDEPAGTVSTESRYETFLWFRNARLLQRPDPFIVHLILTPKTDFMKEQNQVTLSYNSTISSEEENNNPMRVVRDFLEEHSYLKELRAILSREERLALAENRNVLTKTSYRIGLAYLNYRINQFMRAVLLGGFGFYSSQS